MTTANKRCFTCELLLPRECFTSAKTKPDGLSSSCRSCKKAYDARRYAEKADTLLAQHAEWRRKNGDHIASYRRGWLAAHADRVRAVRQDYERRNADKIRARKAARRAERRGEAS